MINYVMKLNFLREMKMNPLMIFIQELCEIIIYFMMMINRQKNILIKQGYLLFVIPLQKLKRDCSLMNQILIKGFVNQNHKNSLVNFILFLQQNMLLYQIQIPLTLMKLLIMFLILKCWLSKILHFWLLELMISQMKLNHQIYQDLIIFSHVYIKKKILLHKLLIHLLMLKTLWMTIQGYQNYIILWAWMVL